LSWQTLLAVGSGGFVGAIARMYMFYIINSLHNYPIPIATIIVNAIGSFILGGLFAYMQKYSLEMPLKSFLATGMLGAFTTFSTFALEAVLLLPSIKLFLLYTSLTVVCSIIFALIAYKGMLIITG